MLVYVLVQLSLEPIDGIDDVYLTIMHLPSPYKLRILHAS